MKLTGIGKQNVKAFLPVVPPGEIKDGVIAVGAIEDDRPAAAMILSEYDGSLNIDHIYVAESFRRRGIGSRLMSAVIKELKPIMVSASFLNRHTDLYAFFEESGFTLLGGTEAYSIPVDELCRSEAFRKVAGSAGNYGKQRLDKLSARQKSLITAAYEKAGCDPQIIESGRIYAPLSMAITDRESGELLSCVICDRAKDCITLLQLICFGDDVMAVPDTLAALSEELKGEETEDCIFCFSAINEEMSNIIDEMKKEKLMLNEEGTVINAMRVMRRTASGR